MKEMLVAKQLVWQYLQKYPELYSEWERQCILDYIRTIYSDGFIPDLVREVYDEVGIVPDDRNVYVEFSDLLRSVFPIEERNILEVGGGVIPRLGKRISEVQTTGKITVYDPRLSKYEKDTDKLHLVRKKFTNRTKIGDTNLMIALMPCEAIETFIRSATSNKIDFMLGFCEGGPHGDEYDYFEDEDEWIHSMLYQTEDLIKENHMGKMKVKTLPRCRNPYPVIYNER